MQIRSQVFHRAKIAMLHHPQISTRHAKCRFCHGCDKIFGRMDPFQLGERNIFAAQAPAQTQTVALQGIAGAAQRINAVNHQPKEQHQDQCTKQV
ncbi:hypothetical protein SDC9_192499 [bioreactor metagenome]|uniref:Uncharacterized protein n=1 Tax=bioreactor metagenome TaxID=1076179 RepID=A0A645I2F8_9ZZZZ